MPLDNQNNPKCINHPEQIMTKSEKRSAITNLEKNGDRYTFIPDSGIPVRVFVCPKCGYVEIYFEK